MPPLLAALIIDCSDVATPATIADAPDVPLKFRWRLSLEVGRLDLRIGCEAVDAAAERRAAEPVPLTGAVSVAEPTTTAPENVGDSGRVWARNGNASRSMPPLPAGSITVMPRPTARRICSCTAGSNSTRMSGALPPAKKFWRPRAAARRRRSGWLRRRQSRWRNLESRSTVSLKRARVQRWARCRQYRRRCRRRRGCPPPRCRD